MELRTLRYFTVVAQELNITRAAEKRRGRCCCAGPSRQAEYILVWNKGQVPSGLTRELIRYVQNCLEKCQAKA